MAQSGFNGFTLPKKDKGPTIPSIDSYTSKLGLPLVEIGGVLKPTIGTGIYTMKPATDGKYIYMLHTTNNGSSQNYIYKYNLKGNLIQSFSIGSSFSLFGTSGLYFIGDYLYLFQGHNAIGKYFIVDKNTMTIDNLSGYVYGSSISSLLGWHENFSLQYLHIFYIDNILYLISFSGGSVYIDKYSIGQNGILVSLGMDTIALGSSVVFSNIGVDYSKITNNFYIYNCNTTDYNKLYVYNIATKSSSTITISGTTAPVIANPYLQFYCCAYGNVFIKYLDPSFYHAKYFYINPINGTVIYSDYSTNSAQSSAQYTKNFITKSGIYYHSIDPVSKFLPNNSSTAINATYNYGAIIKNDSCPIPSYYLSYNGFYIFHDLTRIYVYSDTIPLI